MSQQQIWSSGPYAPPVRWCPEHHPDYRVGERSSPTSVHTQESEPQEGAADLPIQSAGPPDVPGQRDIDEPGPAKEFRHSGWASTRDRVALALQASDAPASRIAAFDQCGSKAYVLESITEPGHFKIASNKCKDRFCKPCARERASGVARNLLAVVDDKRLRFITLTLKTETPNLTHELNRLYKAFQAIRRRKFWKRHIVGGAALLEVKYNKNSERWHPHLHVLVEGTYVPHTGLASEWRHVTGGSFIVDVRAVKDNARVTHYICKYATDPIDRSIGGSVDLLTQAIDAFRGRKTCLTFGTWRGVVLSATGDNNDWQRIATLDHVIQSACWGYQHSIKILESLWVYAESTPKHTRNPDGRSSPPPDPTLFSA